MKTLLHVTALLSATLLGGTSFAAAKVQIDAKRIERAKDVLGVTTLGVRKQRAIMRAHLVGEGELGRNGSKAKVGNYTWQQIRTKNAILTKAGFKSIQIRPLMEKKVVGWLDDLAAIGTAVTQATDTYNATKNLMEGKGTAADYLKVGGMHQTGNTIEALDKLGKGDYAGANQANLRAFLLKDE